MSKRAPLAIIVLICFAGAAWFIIARVPPPPPLVEADYTAESPVVVHHQKADSTERYYGSLPVAGCLVLSGGVVSSGTTSTKIILALKTFEPRDPCEDPAAEALPQEFEVSLTSASLVTFGGVTINNQPVDYRLEEN